MIAPNPIVRQKDEEEGAVSRRRAVSTGTPTPFYQSPTETGVLIHRRGRGVEYQSYPLTIGMKGTTELSCERVLL